MERLLKLAERIKDPDLRKKTVELLKNPEISNPEISYTRTDLSELPAWIGGHHPYSGGLVDHTVSVVELAIKISKHFENVYGVKVNLDHVISGALLHDVMKVFLLTKLEGAWTFTGCTLDHAVFAAAELYARGFPEEVIHIVASHGGDLGTSGANPRTVEALIVFHADVMDSSFDSFLRGGVVLVREE